MRHSQILFVINLVVLHQICAAQESDRATRRPAIETGQSIVTVAMQQTQQPLARNRNNSGPLVYVGTYTRGASQGIYSFRFDSKSGALKPAGVTSGVTNPSFLAIHPNRRFLYAVNEVPEIDGEPAGGVSAFAIDAESGALTFMNRQSAGGPGPCHLVVDETGKNVLVANYGGGSIACLPISSDGSLQEASAFVQHRGASINPTRQNSPHAHSINLDAGNRFAFVADLGLDKVLVYRFDAERGTLKVNRAASTSVDSGAGPRHFAFHPDGRTAYVINELASTVTQLSYNDETGELEPGQTVSTLPRSYVGRNSTADVHVHPSGRFLFGSNRGHDSIAVFAVNAIDGSLTAIGHYSTEGKTPRNFCIDPSGKFLLAANQSTNSIVVFKIDPYSGRLDPTGQTVEVPSPVCIKFLSE